ncbi:hypothetical protein [Gandjariella thermophila]|uniref:Uncharacterized protein n=1 Tax=Gandjariella thermophila TaxID=1931992 RepID=A0A4D4JG09_9PSEU|nr:hypothetical protein [Gandjariella thermophila]GDY33588.1 hypothetical protein GTS_52210 [Gandjariella thermophila]
MERGSGKHGPRTDDELARELEGTLRGNRTSRAEEWRDPEPPADDDPDVRRAPGRPEEEAIQQREASEESE